MSFAAALHGPARALFLGAGAVSAGSAYLSHRRVHLDDSSPIRRPREKLSIYPEPTPDIVLVETHTGLERNIGNVRKVATTAYLEGQSRVQGLVNDWIGVEHAVERKVKEIVPPDESITPGILYVGVATLTGSVLGRNRLLLRLLLPPTFLVLSMNQFLPKTSHNLWAYLSELEQTYLPSVAKQHRELEKQTAGALTSARQTYHQTREWLAGSLETGVSTVQNQTGLKIGEAWGMAKDIGERVVEEARELGTAVEKRAEAMTERVEKEIEQVKETRVDVQREVDVVQQKAVDERRLV